MSLVTLSQPCHAICCYDAVKVDLCLVDPRGIETCHWKKPVNVILWHLSGLSENLTSNMCFDQHNNSYVMVFAIAFVFLYVGQFKCRIQ